MCTVTFMPRRTGYCLAMNRDEKRARPQGLPPAQRIIGGHFVVYPSEPGGGTWIALNDSGACLALINWYSVAGRVKRGSLSRGKVILSVGAASTWNFVDAGLKGIPLRRVNPFRLIVVFPASRQIIEWRWDLKRLIHEAHRWRLQQWVSSGLDEPRAQQVRGRTFKQVQSQSSVGSLNWLRRLHRSHSPQAGPFSTCMHRQDAATVSYTEVSVLGNAAGMRYIQGAPCNRSDGSPHHRHASDPFKRKPNGDRSPSPSFVPESIYGWPLSREVFHA